MKGKLIKRDNNWYVTHIMDDNGVIFGVDYPLSLDDIKQIEVDAQIFDNIEARISSSPDCIFEIITIDNGDNGERYAKLIPDVNNQSQALDFLIEQAQELDLGYNTRPKNKIVKMTEEEWVVAENNLKPKYTPGKGISFYITNEISDGEIEEEAQKRADMFAKWHEQYPEINQHAYWRGFVDSVKWYREQLKSRQ